MPINIAVLAASVVADFLFPYVKKGVKEIAEKATKKASDKIWKWVSNLFGSEKEKKTMELFKDDPEIYNEPVKKILQKKLEEDEELVKQLEQMIKEVDPKGDTKSWKIIADQVGVVDVSGSVITGGTLIGLQVQPSPEEKKDAQSKKPV